MPRHFLVTLVVLVLAIAVPTTSWANDDDPVPYKPGPPISYERLTLFALFPLDDTKPDGDYVSFDEATRKKLIKVTELDGNTSDARVDTVHVSNRGDKPVFILAGEIVLGGKQDRVIAKDTIVPAKANKLAVSVFCVEKGRWDGKTANFRSGGSVAHPNLRDKAIFSDDQSAVWGEVSKANKRNAAATNTDTYRASLDKADSNEAIAKYKKAVLPPLRAQKGAVGVAVAIGGKLVAIDAFANPVLFAAVRDKLVRSYVLEAIGRTDAKPRAASQKQAEKFLTTVRKTKKTNRRAKSGAADNAYYDGDAVLGNESAAPEAKPAHKYFRAKEAME